MPNRDDLLPEIDFTLIKPGLLFRKCGGSSGGPTVYTITEVVESPHSIKGGHLFYRAQDDEEAIPERMTKVWFSMYIEHGNIILHQIGDE